MESTDTERPRRISRRRPPLFATAMLALAILTAWNVTRSDALDRAEHAYNRVDLPGCLGHALDHLDRRPWSREAARLAALCLSRLDFADRAEPFYARAGRLSLADRQVRAFGLVRSPHPERAIPAYREILEDDPTNITAMRRFAAVLLAENDKDELLLLAERLDGVEGGAVLGAMLRGTVYHNDENPQRAVEAFETVLRLDPGLEQMPASRSLFWRQLTEDLVECGRLEDSARYLIRALESARDPELVARLAQTYFLRGDLDQAVRYFRESAESDPTLSAPLVGLARIALQRGRPTEALPELERARMLDPHNHAVLYSLALTYRQLGRAADSDRVRLEMDQIRSESTRTPSDPHPQWPRHAL